MNARDPIHDEGQLLRADVEMLYPSPTNPRKSFPEAELLELAESIKQLGVMQPILVRPLSAEIKQLAAPLADHAELEIIAGERRWRASRLAGLVDVPVLLRHLDDRTVICMQIVENLQRANLNAMDEAEGFGQLQAQGMGVQAIADQICKSKAYVYAKLKLLALCPAVRDALRSGSLIEAIALLIARIPVETMQLDALRVVTARDDYTAEPMSYRTAKAHIGQHYTKNLAKAAFDVDDASLLQDVGSCTFCPHRLGNQPECEPGNANVCTNPPCFELKRQAHNILMLNLPADTPRIDVPRANAAYPTNYTDYDNAGLRLLGNTNHHDPARRTYTQWLADHGETVPIYIHTCPHSGDSRAVARVADLAAAADRIAKATAASEEQARLDVAVEQPEQPTPPHESLAQTSDDHLRDTTKMTQTTVPAIATPRRREHSPLEVAYTQYRTELKDRIRANPPMFVAGPLLQIVALSVTKRTPASNLSDAEAVDILIANAISYAEHWHDDAMLEQLAAALGIDHAELLERYVPVPEGCARPNENGVYPAQQALKRDEGKATIKIKIAQTADGWRCATDITTPSSSTSSPICDRFSPAHPTRNEAVKAGAAALKNELTEWADGSPTRDRLIWWLDHLIEGLDRGDGTAPVLQGHTVRYRHPEKADLVWSGKGKKPKWVADWIAAGKPLTELETKLEATTQ